MKKLILTLALAVMALAASANSVRYFTRPQANRVANALDAQNELMIYCGYEYELATYVIVSEVWAEPVNSKYYEIWLFGYDAYTGEEIYMPLDLSCIWLFNATGSRMYSAAQYLRFRSTVAMPNFYWTMPPYNSFVRHFHDPMFRRGYTYHYEIHRFGWRPPAPPTSGPWPYHPYYMRTPYTPAPVPTKPFTPGVNYPQTPDGHGYIGNTGRTTVGTRSSTLSSTGGERSGSVRNNAGNPGTTNRSSSTTNTGTTSRNSGTTNTGTTSRNSGTTTTNTGTTSRNSGSTTTNTGTTSRNSGTTTTNTGTTSRNSGTTTTNTGTTSRNSGTTTTNTGTTSRNSGTTTTNTGTTSRNSGTTTTNTGTTSRNSGSTTNTGTTSRNSGSTTNTGTTSRNSGSTTNSGTTNSGTTSRGTNNRSGK